MKHGAQVKQAVSPNPREPHLSERISKLSVRRQEIVRPIIEQPREYVLLSVRAMAARLKTDPATIVRIVRGIGFANYRAFQRYLHELSLAMATSLDTMQSSPRSEGEVAENIWDALDQDLKNLQGLKHSMDTARLQALAKRCYEARQIFILGGDLAEYLAGYLQYHLNLLGLFALVATSPGRAYHLTRGAGKGDLVIAITFRRGLRETVDGVKRARKKGAYCVGISDTYLSPLVPECDEMFLASITSPSFGASYTAPIALLQSISVACGQLRRAQTLAIVEEIAEEQRKGIRWCTTS